MFSYDNSSLNSSCNEKILRGLYRKSKYILCSKNFFSRKSYRLFDNVETCGRARQATDDNTALNRKHAICMLDN